MEKMNNNSENSSKNNSDVDLLTNILNNNQIGNEIDLEEKEKVQIGPKKDIFEIIESLKQNPEPFDYSQFDYEKEIVKNGLSLFNQEIRDKKDLTVGKTENNVKQIFSWNNSFENLKKPINIEQQKIQIEEIKQNNSENIACMEKWSMNLVNLNR